MRNYYYLTNVRHDRFALEVRYLLPGYHEFGDVSNYVIVSLYFDVRVRTSSPSDDHNRRRRGGAAASALAPPATIAAWSLSNGSDGDEHKGKTTTALIEELGRATFAEEQDRKPVQDLIKKANHLMSSMVLAALQRPDKFIASLYYEEWNDDSVVVDMAFSNHHYHDKEEDQFASETNNNDYNSLFWNSDNNNNNASEDNNNENIHSMLAELAADTNRLFYSNYKKKR